MFLGALVFAPIGIIPYILGTNPLEQLPLQLSKEVNYDVDNFIQSPSNALAYDYLTRWPNWNALGVVIVGPPYAGKTHLAHLWQKLSKARFLERTLLDQLKETLSFEEGKRFILEDMERHLPQEEAFLFHLFNQLKSEGGSLLITAKSKPSQWNIGLKDLSSRLATLPVFEIQEPDDLLFVSVLTKHFSEYQMKVDPKVLDFILKHVPRTFENLYGIPKKLNEASLKARHAVTIPFVKSVLGI